MFEPECGKWMATVREAIAARDPASFGRGVHALDGMFRSLSAVSARQAVEAMRALDPARHRDAVAAGYARLEREVSALEAELAGLAAGSGAAALPGTIRC